jgi:hypothetical protein
MTGIIFLKVCQRVHKDAIVRPSSQGPLSCVQVAHQHHNGRCQEVEASPTRQRNEGDLQRPRGPIQLHSRVSETTTSRKGDNRGPVLHHHRVVPGGQETVQQPHVLSARHTGDVATPSFYHPQSYRLPRYGVRVAAHDPLDLQSTEAVLQQPGILCGESREDA